MFSGAGVGGRDNILRWAIGATARFEKSDE